MRGFRSALAAHGIEEDDSLVQQGEFTFESGLSAAETLLDRAERDRPTTIFASNDDMAAAVSLVAHRRGLRVPQDLAAADQGAAGD